MALRDLHIGRLALLTYENDVQQALGDEITTVGGGVVPGSRRPRPVQYTIPVHGDSSEADPYSSGARMRRQAVALMENTLVKLQALYLVAAPDSELNGWYIIGTGTLTYQAGGPALATYQLQLQDAYRVGTQRTHRPARRCSILDRRLATSPRDYLGTLYSTDFAAVTALALAYLPIGATDITGLRKVPYVALYRTGQGGTTPVVTGMVHGEVLAYEQAELLMGLQDDVVVYDRRGRGDVPQGYGSRVLADAPLAWWRLDEAVGATVVADAGASGLYTGTYVGAVQQRQPSLTQDPATYSVGLSGPMKMYTKVVDVASLRLASDLTCEAIIQPATGTVNLLDNSSFEVELHPWDYAGANSGTATITAVTLSPTWSDSGAQSLRFQAAGGASGGSWTILSGYRGGATALSGSAIAVIAGRTYSARAVFNVVDAASGGTKLRIEFRDAANNSLGSTDSAANVGTGVQTLTASAVAPANAVFAFVDMINTMGVGDTMDVYMDSVAVIEGTPAALAALTYQQLRPRYDVLMSKWRTIDGYRAWRCAYDAYMDALVFDVSSNGSTSHGRAYSNALGLAAAAQASGGRTKAHVGVAYAAALGRATFFYNGLQVGQVTGLPTSVFAGTASLTVGKWESD